MLLLLLLYGQVNCVLECNIDRDDVENPFGLISILKIYEQGKCGIVREDILNSPFVSCPSG